MFAGAEAERYARKIRARAPGYEALHEIAAAWLQGVVGAGEQILVVGAGDGEDLVRLAQAEPTWRLTGVEPEPDMCRLAARRIREQGLAAQVELRQGFVSDLPTAPAYSAASAILVSHFLRDDGAKVRFFADIAARLRPGASLLAADLETGDPELTPALWRWMAARGVSQPALAAIQHRMAQDFHPVSRERLNAILQEAGFSPVRPLFQALAYAAWVARRLSAR